jgi:hypothetical protein
MSSPLAGSEDEVSICSTSSESNDTSDSGDSSDEHCDSGERSFPDNNSDVSGDDTDTAGERVRDDGLDFPWPAADTFTDDAFGRPEITTCSELGSQRIRLLRIQPGPSSSMISLDTKICFLDHAGQYIALSYTWGSPVLQRQVIINDEPRAVTTNLWRFLSQARKLPNRFSGWLWIDAVSIDQTDPWEKAEQVKIISKIFAVAKQAVVWLGPAYGDSDRAMKALGNMPLRGAGRKSRRSLWAPPVGPAVLALCNRAYWQRLWVFQELKASDMIDLWCGDRNVNFDRVRAFLLTQNIDSQGQVQYQALEKSPARRMVASTRDTLNTSLWSTLDATRHLRCTNPLDRVYAILNVVSTGREGIEADYTVTLSELMNAVLLSMFKYRKPKDLYMLFAECDSVERLFAVDKGSMFKVEGAASRHLLQITPFKVASDFHSGGYRSAEFIPTAISLHAWCKRYDQKKVGVEIQRTLRKGLLDLKSSGNAKESTLEGLTAAAGLFDSL